MNNIKLHNGFEIPCMGMGTWPLKNKELLNSILYGQQYGFKLIDSARDYGHEPMLGNYLQEVYNKNKIVRKDIFLTTKIGNTQQIKQNIKQEIDTSLKNLQTEYLDLWLMHWPYPEHYIDTWRQMEEVYQSGKVKAIGVCNFRERHLEKLLSACSIKPMINQFEVHPLKNEEKLIHYCGNLDIIVQAHTPLGLMDKKIVSSVELNNLAKKYNKSIAQIILRWHIQRGVVPIPKSGTKERLKENISIFDFSLSDEEMRQINSLDENYKFYIESHFCPGY